MKVESGEFCLAVVQGPLNGGTPLWGLGEGTGDYRAQVWRGGTAGRWHLKGRSAWQLRPDPVGATGKKRGQQQKTHPREALSCHDTNT